MEYTGKTSVTSKLALMLNAFNVYEPGSSPDLRNCIKKDAHRPALEQLLLFMADRVAVHKDIRGFLKSADVIGDRGFPSTLVYQGIIGKQMQTVIALHNLYAKELIYPDHIFILDVDLVTALRRAKARVNADAMDKRWMSQFAQVRNAYKKVAEKLNAKVIDTSKLTVDEVIQEIVKDI